MAIHSARIQILNDAPIRPERGYVLYWMQQAQRAAFNPALEYAVEEANALERPVVVCFGLTDGFPEANARHYAFMLQGLARVAQDLETRGIRFVLRRGSPEAVALDLGRKAALIVCDRGYLAIQKSWRAALAAGADCRVVQVEGEVVVPVEAASGKHEFAARTLRPKIHRLWEPYLAPLRRRRLAVRSDSLALAGDLDLDDVPALVASLDIDHDVRPVRRFLGGEHEARRRLKVYLAGPFAHYGRERGKPEAGAASHMSPYLHFGQISPVEIALAVQEAQTGGPEDRSAYLEELIVRRELAMNHVFYEPRYDRYASMPDWARRTLEAAAGDPRPHLYSEAQLDAGETHDRHWNAAMQEMRETGYMHNHMRMYWGKKIIEWSASPEQAFAVTLRLNNRYFLDGRDANSFTNVGWLFGLHDRPWFRRPIFGTVRYLGAATLKKFDSNAYLAEVARLAALEAEA